MTAQPTLDQRDVQTVGTMGRAPNSVGSVQSAHLSRKDTPVLMSPHYWGTAGKVCRQMEQHEQV